MELGHPALLPGNNILAIITLTATWWTVLHVLQVALSHYSASPSSFSFVDLGRAAAISRYAFFILIVVYPAFDGPWALRAAPRLWRAARA